MKRKKLFAILFVVISALSCKDFSAVRDPYTIYSHLPMEPSTLNPVTATDAYSSAVFGYIYQSLIRRDEDTLEMRPELATRWDISADGMRYVFHLRTDVRWSDGVPFTADDVLYSYQKIMDPRVASARLKVYYKDIRSVSRLDRYTVEFIYARPYFLALEICGGMTIIPKHIFDDGTDFNTHTKNRNPIGTGPYVFDRWVTGKKLELSRNERYYDKKPEIKRIVFKIISEDNIALQMLKKGELDMMTLRTIQWVRQTNSADFEKRFYKLKYFQPYFNYIGWNSLKPMFADKRVRRALTMLVNREDILKKLLFGLGKVVSGTFYINSKSYDQKIAPWPYDPPAAKRLLKEAGWIDRDGDGILDRDGGKFRFTLTVPSSAKLSERIATIIKEDLSRVGIEVEISRFEWAVFLEKVHRREFDAVILGWALGFNDDPYQLWHSSQVKEGSNFCTFKNAEADRIIEQARVEMNEARRITMYRRFHEIMHQEQPYTFMFCTPSLSVVSRRFDNVRVHLTGLKLEEWTVKKP